MADKTPMPTAKNYRSTKEHTKLQLAWLDGIEKGRQMVLGAGDTHCLEGEKHGRPTNYANVKKRECRVCWQALKGVRDESRERIFTAPE